MAKKADKSKDSDAPATGRFVRYGLVLLLAGAVILAWLSMVTYSASDLPAWQFPPPSPVHNAAGVVGVYFGYFLRHYLGGGAYVGLLFASIAAVVLMMGRRIGDFVYRVIGVLLLVTVCSTALCLLEPAGAPDVDNNLAGVLGAALGHYMREQLHLPGAWVLLGISGLMGLLFAADNVMMLLPRLLVRLWREGLGLSGLLSALRARLPKLPSLPRRKAKEPKAAAPASPAMLKLKPAKPAPVKAAAPAPADEPDAEADDEIAPPTPAPVPAPAKSSPKPAGDLPTFRLTPPAETPKPKPKPRPASRDGKYELPSVDLLAAPTGGFTEIAEAAAASKQGVLQQTLTDFGVGAEVVGHMTGPVITMYELALSPGVKVSQVANLATDIARALAVPGVRVVSPLPGKDTVGIEVPNTQKEMVRVRELMSMAPEADTQCALPLYLGKDAGGGPIVADLARMPHMLIAGTTGSGKSVCINTIIMSLLLTRTPDEVKFIMVDPKMVEMAAFENIAHLLCPIVNDMRKAEDILEWAATKMDERYELLKEAGVKNIAGFNRLTAEEIYERFGVQGEEEKARVPLRLPYYVIIIDELADLMMTSSKEVESHIIRIAQKARAVGIHLVLATQRPSVNVVTGLIKSNMPCRCSFRVASRQESRIVLDQNGAEVLMGQGDMLFLQPGTSNLIRAQGTYLDDNEIRAVVKVLRDKCGEPQYNSELIRLQSSVEGEVSGEKDDLFDQAVEIVLASQRGSVSLLQRRLQVGYSRASRIIDQMAEAGLLGDYKGSQARECLLTLEDWQAMKASIAADQSGASSLDGEPTSA